jgi:hypothetical protein
VPFIPVAATFYGVCYGLPVFLAGAQHSNWDNDFRFYDLIFATPIEMIDMEGVLLAGAGSLLFVAAAILTQKNLAVRPFRLMLPKSHRLIQTALWLLAIIHLVWMIDPSIRQIPSLGQFVGPAGLVALGGIFIEIRNGHAGRWQAAALLVMTVFDVMGRVATGTVTQPMLLMLFAFLLLVRLQGKFPRRLLALGVVFTILVYPALQGIRQQIWIGQQERADILRKPQQAAEIFYKYYLGIGDRKKIEDVVASFSVRTGLIFLFTHVVRNTPEPVPYWGGETYKPLVTSWVPRALWPGKPEERLGQAFRERYRLITMQSNPTTINVPWMVEAYANFGRTGLVIGMVLFGVLMAGLDRFFNRSEIDNLSGAVGLAIIFQLTYQESNFSLMAGGLLPLTLALWAWFGLFAFVERRVLRR